MFANGVYEYESTMCMLDFVIISIFKIKCLSLKEISCSEL